MSDGAQVITVTLGDKTFRAGRRTTAHIEFTIAELEREHPGAHLHIIQPCYNDGVSASEGTHDKDGVIDVEIVGLSWPDTQTFMRRKGWAAWWRHAWQGFSHHVHAVSLGCPGPVGEFVPGQIDDYHAHAWGLAGLHDPGSDPTWFPPDIDSTVFDYAAWEDDLMALTEEQTRTIIRDELATFLANATVNNPSNPKGTPWKLSRLLIDTWKRAGK